MSMSSICVGTAISFLNPGSNLVIPGIKDCANLVLSVKVWTLNVGKETPRSSARDII